MYIDSQEKLEDFISRALSSKILAIDTEFLREKTYWARLCLIQLATDTEVAIVDPFKISSYKSFAELLVNESVVKVFHAASQDLEILYHETGVLPRPVFDTQIAATLLGTTQQVGYATLVHSTCGVTLKKLDSFTDWSIRPLSASQLEYAADDVIYLPQVYRSLTEELASKNRLNWLKPDFEELLDPSRYEVNPRSRFRKLKRVSHLSQRQLSAAREVAAWREMRAQEVDIPRKWVLTDEQIVEACKREPRTVDELYMVRGLRERLGLSDARTIVDLIHKGLNVDPEDLPSIDAPSKSEVNVDATLDLMTALLRLRAKEHSIAMPTLASHEELSMLARGHTQNLQVLSGWRKSIIGNDLVALANGELSLSVIDNTLRVERIAPKCE